MKAPAVTKVASKTPAKGPARSSAPASRIPPPQSPLAAAAARLGNRGMQGMLAIQRKCSCGGTCPLCRANEETQLQRRSSGHAPTHLGIALAQGIASRSGRPLDTATRTEMESRLGADFSAVRVHTDAPAVEAARAIGAQAFTTGSHIAFDNGRFDPSSAPGRSLLSHELTHVIQQSRGLVAPGSIDSGPSDSLEVAAAASERSVAAHRPASSHLTPSPQPTSEAVGVQRQPADDLDLAPPKEVGPCLIDAPSLNNAELLYQLNRTRVYLSQHSRGEDDWFDYHNLFRRLLRQREARIQAGHLWLRQPGLLDIPPTLYLISPSAHNQLRVTQVAGAWAIAVQLGSEVVITQEQFRLFINEKQLPVIDYSPAKEDGYFFDPLTNRAGIAGFTAILSLDQETIARAPDAAHFIWMFDQPIMMGEGPQADLPGFSDASGGPFPPIYNLPSSNDPAHADSNPEFPPIINMPAWAMPDGSDAATASLVAMNELRESPEKYSPTGPERIRVPQTLSEDSDAYQPAGVIGTRLRPAPLLPEGSMGIIYQGSHVSDFVVINGETVIRGFRSTLPRHIGSVIDRKVFGGGGGPFTTTLNVGVASAYHNDALYPFLGGPKQGHWPGGVVAVYRNGAPIDADQLLKAMADAQVSMKGQEYRFHLPDLSAEHLALVSRPEAELAGMDLPKEIQSPKVRDAIRKAMKRAGLDWKPCGGTNCINVPADIHQRALGTPLQIVVDGNVINLADPRFASTDMMSKYVQQPDEYFEARGLSRANIGGKAARKLGRAGMIGAGTSLGMDLITGHFDSGSASRAAFNFGGGTVGYVAEEWAATGLTTKLVQSGMTSGSAATLGRLGGATAVGVVLAPAITGLEMFFDDNDYVPSDYAARLTRSATVGVISTGSGVLATAAFFAVAGSEFPIIGNIIGFGVGLIVGLAADSAIGDPIEEGIREYAGQQGCKGFPTEGW